MVVATAASPFKVTDGQILEQLVAHFGILTYVAVALGVSRTTIHKRVKNSLPLQEVRDLARGEIIATAEEKLMAAIEDGASWAIRYTLNTLGRAEGFGAPRKARKPRDEAAEAPVMEQPPELDEIRGHIADAAQMRLIGAIQNGEPWAVKYCLSTLGRSVGYGAQTAEIQKSPEMAELTSGLDNTVAQTPDRLTAQGAQTPTPVASGIVEPRLVGTVDVQELDGCASPNAEDRGCTHGDGAQTPHQSATARHHGDPATREKKRRERKLRKQRVRENRVKSRR